MDDSATSEIKKHPNAGTNLTLNVALSKRALNTYAGSCSTTAAVAYTAAVESVLGIIAESGIEQARRAYRRKMLRRRNKEVIPPLPTLVPNHISTGIQASKCLHRMFGNVSSQPFTGYTSSNVIRSRNNARKQKNRERRDALLAGRRAAAAAAEDVSSQSSHGDEEEEQEEEEVDSASSSEQEDFEDAEEQHEDEDEDEEEEEEPVPVKQSKSSKTSREKEKDAKKAVHFGANKVHPNQAPQKKDQRAQPATKKPVSKVTSSSSNDESGKRKKHSVRA